MVGMKRDYLLTTVDSSARAEAGARAVGVMSTRMTTRRRRHRASTTLKPKTAKTTDWRHKKTL
jgi:hypothetical protein